MSLYIITEKRTALKFRTLHCILDSHFLSYLQSKKNLSWVHFCVLLAAYTVRWFSWLLDLQNLGFFLVVFCLSFWDSDKRFDFSKTIGNWGSWSKFSSRVFYLIIYFIFPAVGKPFLGLKVLMISRVYGNLLSPCSLSGMIRVFEWVIIRSCTSYYLLLIYCYIITLLFCFHIWVSYYFVSCDFRYLHLIFLEKFMIKKSEEA